MSRVWGNPLPPLLLAASTHDGEEKAVADVFLQLRRDFPLLALVVAPRHAERREAVVSALTACGLRSALRSDPENAPANPDVFLIDSTGELAAWQALATVVVIGKSFLAAGGQNPAEAIACGVPVITGPHMENFQPLMELLLAAGGITRVSSLDALGPALVEVLADPDKASAVAARGREALGRHRGAAARSVDAISKI